jgi:uncharacterized protein
VEKGSDEVAINEAETEIGYYAGDSMDLEDSLREQILLAVPIKSLCRTIAKACARSAGQSQPAALRLPGHQSDPRWAALGELKKLNCSSEPFGRI